MEADHPVNLVLRAEDDRHALVQFFRVDVEDAAENVNVGDELEFWPGYGALLALATSPYVQKVVIRG